MNRVTEQDLARMPWHARERLIAGMPQPVKLLGWPALWDDSADAQQYRRETLAAALEGFRCA